MGQEHRESGSRKLVFAVLTAYMLVFVLAGVILDPQGIPRGIASIVSSPSVLISDYMVIGGLGAAMVNAGLVGLAGVLLVVLTRPDSLGASIAGVFTMAGFAFFGKNVLNIWPTIAGVWLYSRVMRQPFKKYVSLAMFGTALSPLASIVAIESGLGPMAGLGVGIVAGIALPPIAAYAFSMHGGLSLYNTGFTAGFVGTVFVAMLRGFGLNIKPLSIWGMGFNSLTAPFMMAYLISMIVLGRICAGSWKSLAAVQKQKGVLPSDFVDSFNLGTVLMNMGCVGCLGLAYVVAVGGEINGPTIGGILTMVGFGAFGKNTRNCLHIMAGVLLATMVSVWHPADPGPLLAALFGTNLAPIAGMFGPLAGIAAGCLHLALVMNLGDLHGGVNLYNNGFAGGLVAVLGAALVQHISSHRK
ncbi:MAG TPA: DUF1576 domain-containing protein [Firmicutes bacterium]|nr:DUF1576 domain-containing protein [Bacillota bacterium]